MTPNNQYKQQCDKEVFDYGKTVGIFDIPKEEAESYCKEQTEKTEVKHDWHYAGGRVVVKALYPNDKLTIRDQADEIIRLQTKVDELEKRNELLEEANTRQGVVALSLATQCDTLQESEATLKVMVERLEDKLAEIEIHEEDDEKALGIHNVLMAAPAQSLAAHNQKIERETIERCAKELNATVCGNDECNEIIKELQKDIRDLKDIS